MEIFCSLRPKAEEEAADESLQLVPLVLVVAFSGIEIMLLLFCSAEACAVADAAAAADEDDDDDFLSSVMVELTIFCCEKH